MSSKPEHGHAERRSVLVVGAGPVGLALAIELGIRGVDCLLVERNDRVGVAPRAKTTNVRTRTHLRRWGIADRLAAESPFGVEYPSDILFVTRLGGELLARIPNASNCAPERNELYPEHAQWIPQYKLERVLRDRAEELDGVEIRLGTELLEAEQDEGLVTARLRDLESGKAYEVACDYLVGADGARSRVRDLIGAAMHGTYGLSRNYNIVFRAPGLAEAHRHGPATMYWQVNARAPGLIGPMDKGDIWFFMPTRLPQGFAIPDEEAADLIREATGVDLPYEIISRDEWAASRLIADRYRDRRVLLAGDACHLHPPFGGFGMNMGVADAVDLGWKIAANLQGWGGEALLDSYEAERRPIHEQVMDEAVANHAVLSNDFVRDALEEDTEEGRHLRAEAGDAIVAAKAREFHTLGTVLGTCYASSPVIVVGEGDAPVSDPRRYAPSAAPGCLAPHLWLSEDTSLYDRFGTGFALVVGERTDILEVSKVVAEAVARGVPLEVVDVGGADPHDHYTGRMTLVRPDQHVAWRGAVWEPGTIAVVTGRAGRASGKPEPMLAEERAR